MQQPPKSTRHKKLLYFLGLIVVVLLINFITHYIYLRVDLTSDKRYTISEASKSIVKNIDDIVFIRIYLDGEMPIIMKKFQRSIREKLDELVKYSNKHIQYDFRNPSEGNDLERERIYSELSRKGMRHFYIQENDAEGGTTQRLLFPGAIINYKGKEIVLNFIQENQRYTPEENLNFADQNLEYNIVSSIDQISRITKPRIAFVEGHGELNDYQLGDIMHELSGYYTVERIILNGKVGILDDYKAVIVAKPTKEWNESDKLVIDQYIMNGGRTAWFIDAVNVYEDSLAVKAVTLALTCNHNLNDQLFRYGIRVNSNIIEDTQCAMRYINIAAENSSPDLRLAPWTYFPLLIPPNDNSITKGLNLIRSQYPGVIDTVNINQDIKKTYLLFSSEHSKVSNTPLLISLAHAYKKISDTEYNKSFLPVAALLEGCFESSFNNRMIKQYNNDQLFSFKNKSERTKMIIVSDGDIIRNDVTYRADRVIPRPLGYDRDMNQFFGNKDFVKNIINYLADENDLMQVRNHDYVLRLLDKTKLIKYRLQIILINTVLPLALIILFGFLFMWRRKSKYAR